MAEVKVQSQLQAQRIIALIGNLSRNMAAAHVRRSFWDRLSENLIPTQREWWSQRGWRAGILSPGTVRARSARRGYYSNPRNPDAAPEGPKWVWTGLMRKSTTILTQRTRLAALIDTGQSYAGPIKGSDPVGSLVERGAGLSPWDLRSRVGPTSMEATMDRTLLEWVIAEVVPRAIRSI